MDFPCSLQLRVTCPKFKVINEITVLSFTLDGAIIVISSSTFQFQTEFLTTLDLLTIKTINEIQLS